MHYEIVLKILMSGIFTIKYECPIKVHHGLKEYLWRIFNKKLLETKLVLWKMIHAGVVHQLSQRKPWPTHF